MEKKERFLESYILKNYQSAPFMTKQRVYVLMWMQIVYMLLNVTTQTLTNILSPHAATKFYNISMIFLTFAFMVCFIILKSGTYRIAAYLSIVLPLVLMTLQGLQISTESGKFVFMYYLVMFIVMASLLGDRITIIFITAMVITGIILIVTKSGDIIPVDKHGSSIVNLSIASFFTSVVCILTSWIVKATLEETEKKNTELEESLAGNNEILTTCTSVAYTLKNTAENLSVNSATFSDSARAQAAGVEEISSTMEEMLSSVSQSADNSAEAELISEKSYKLAGEGTEIVNKAVIAINEVNESSRKISDIINLINDIAFQTNLLALNASVEAARAGDSGRGFAVVASEVRNLAQRSRGASDEISKLIKASVEKISIGTDLVNKSGRALKEIFGSIEQTRKIISEINSVSREQKEGLGQVTNALNQADVLSQKTATAAEELFYSSEQLKKNSAELQELMSIFKN